MTDFTVFNKALKLCWVKRLCSTDDAPWKAIPTSLLLINCRGHTNL